MVIIIDFSSPGFVHPFAIDNFEDQLYWTDWKSDKLSSISKFNASDVKTLKEGLFAPMGIKVYHPTKQLPGKKIENIFFSIC